MSKRRGASDDDDKVQGTLQFVHTPFCAADRLQDGAKISIFAPGVGGNDRRIGMLTVEQVETCCWTCLKPGAPVVCANCNTGRYCSDDCRTADSLIHAQFCKIDGKFYWPPPPKLGN